MSQILSMLSVSMVCIRIMGLYYTTNHIFIWCWNTKTDESDMNQVICHPFTKWVPRNSLLLLEKIYMIYTFIIEVLQLLALLVTNMELFCLYFVMRAYFLFIDIINQTWESSSTSEETVHDLYILGGFILKISLRPPAPNPHSNFHLCSKPLKKTCFSFF